MNISFKPTKSTHILLIILAVVIVYANSLDSKFVWDDTSLIVENPYIKSWHNLDSVFTKNIYHGANKLINYYRPLQLLSYMAEYSIWGLNTFGYHLMNLMLHAMNAVLVYLLILAIFGSSGIGLLTALMFVTAPAISSVTYYVSARADLLVAMFMLLSALTFFEYHRKRRAQFYVASILSFVFALLSRENAIILPFLLIMIFFQNKERDRKTLLRSISPYFLILLVYIFLRVTVLNFSVAPDELAPGNYITQTPLLYRLLTDFKVLITYLRLLLFPFNLHMNWYIRPVSFILEPGLVFCVGLIASLAIIIKKVSRDHPQILFGVAWFFVTLLPVLNIYPLSTFLHDAWLYVPCIGFFFIFSTILLKIAPRRVGRAIIAIFLLYFTITTVVHGRVWRDNVSLFKNTVKHNSDNPYIYSVHINLALAYFHDDRYEEAMRECHYAISLEPEVAGAYNNLGIFYADKGDYVNAIKNFKICIKLNKELPMPHLNLAVTYNTLGYFNKAVSAITRCIELNPDYHRPYYVLGAIYSNMGEFDKAKIEFAKALTLNNEDPDNKIFSRR